MSTHREDLFLSGRCCEHMFRDERPDYLLVHQAAFPDSICFLSRITFARL